MFVNPALESLGWDPPRFMGTAFQNAWINPVMWNAIMGWTGVDQYDEGNPVGQRFLDRYEAAYGRRPEYCVPVVNRDIATALLRAFADAHPLTPARREGGARAGEDDARRVGRARHPASRSGTGRAAAGWAPATSWPDSSTPTASTPISSTASVRSELDDHRAGSAVARNSSGGSQEGLMEGRGRGSPSRWSYSSLIAVNARTGAVSPRIRNPEVDRRAAAGRAAVRIRPLARSVPDLHDHLDVA